MELRQQMGITFPGVVLLPTLSPQICSLFLVAPHQQWPNATTITATSLSLNSNYLLRQVHTRYRRWDSNAENFRTQNFNFDSQGDEDNDDEDPDEWFGVLEEFIDGVWIFQVFRSFGWMLPAIISSLLLASGPKAFLMALALPLGQSALSFAFQKVWGKKQRKSKRKAKPKKKPHTRSWTNVTLEEEEESERTRKGTVGYQTWVAGNDVRVDKDSQNSASFGGWDELDRGSKFNKESASNSARKTDEPQRSNLSKRVGKGDTPLLLRLLIAVFPILGSWINLL